MINYEKIKELVCNEFNPKKYVPDNAFLRANVVVCEMDSKIIIVVRNKSISSKNPIQLYGFEITKDNSNNVVFNKVATITYNIKNDHIYFSQINVKSEMQGQGIGAAILKSMEYFSTIQVNDKIKIIGYISPDNWNRLDEIKSFYTQNGYAIKKPLFEKYPIIIKIMDKNDLIKNDHDDLITLDCKKTQEYTK